MFTLLWWCRGCGHFRPESQLHKYKVANTFFFWMSQSENHNVLCAVSGVFVFFFIKRYRDSLTNDIRLAWPVIYCLPNTLLLSQFLLTFHVHCYLLLIPCYLSLHRYPSPYYLFPLPVPCYPSLVPVPSHSLFPLLIPCSLSSFLIPSPYSLFPLPILYSLSCSPVPSSDPWSVA